MKTLLIVLAGLAVGAFVYQIASHATPANIAITGASAVVCVLCAITVGMADR